MILVLIPVIAESITLQRPENFQWAIVPENMKNKLLEKTLMGKTLEVQDIPLKEIYLLAGEDLFDQDPSPPRPALKRGRQEIIGGHDTEENLNEESGQLDGQPQGSADVYIAQ